MASVLFRLAARAGAARAQLVALTGASAAFYATSDAEHSRITVPFLPISTALADASVGTSTTSSGGRKVSIESKVAAIALTGFEAVKDAAGFVSTVLDKALKHSKESPLQTLVARKDGAGPTLDEPLGEAPVVLVVDPATFYALLDKQPLIEKVSILDSVVAALIGEAERSAELSALTVGMVGGGTACYALLGWWSDLALPGVGTVGCSAVAGAVGHSRAKAAAARTRTRLVSALLASPDASRNAFVSYLAAPSLDAKQRIASSTRPEVFFSDMYAAVAPLLKQVREPRADNTEAVLNTAA